MGWGKGWVGWDYRDFGRWEGFELFVSMGVVGWILNGE